MRPPFASLLAKRVPSFAIVSLPRSGSTALYRVLSATSRVRIAYEPDFGEAWKSGTELEKYCRRLLARVSGIKHVWDPNGWPFANRGHQSSLETLALSDRWIEVNASLLGCVRKVVHLKRRNQLGRVISDLLGQQTHLWGHDPGKPHSDHEAGNYREQLRYRELGPLDERLIEWYLENGPAWGDRIISTKPDQLTMDVHYEDLFGPGVQIDERMDRVVGIADWLDIPVRLDDEAVRAIMEPSSKFNTPDVYARIPNYREIVARFGEI